MFFVNFDRENINTQDFRQNISNRARSSAFFMYTVFFLEIKSSWRNIGFTVENVVQTKVIQVFCVWIEHSYYVFDSIFDSKSNISPWWLDFQKKYNIHEKCGRVSPIRNILTKVLDIYVLLVKISKNHRKICKLFTVWFPKELAMFRFFRFWPDLVPKSPWFSFSFFSAVTQRFSKIFFWNPLESSRQSIGRNGKTFFK